MAFEGFADDGAKFFKALAKNNERAWFLAHKAEYEEGWNAPMKALLEEVSAGIDKAFPHCDLDTPKIFRIFRDVRFSKDKAPYKTHIGGYIPIKRAGAKSTDVPAALYVQVGAAGTFAGGGHYMMEPASLARFRAAIADDKQGKALVKILAGLEKKGYTHEAREALKRVPKGFDPDHPRAELLKRKGLTVSFPKLPKGLLADRKLVKWLVDASKVSAPLIEWLTFATA